MGIKPIVVLQRWDHKCVDESMWRDVSLSRNREMMEKWPKGSTSQRKSESLFIEGRGLGFPSHLLLNGLSPLSYRPCWGQSPCPTVSPPVRWKRWNWSLWILRRRIIRKWTQCFYIWWPKRVVHLLGELTGKLMPRARVVLSLGKFTMNSSLEAVTRLVTRAWARESRCTLTRRVECKLVPKTRA